MDSLDVPTVAPTWTRPDKLRFNALRTIPWLGGAAVVGLSLITGMMLADEGSAPTVVSIPQPIVVTPTSAPIHVTVAAPALAPVVAEDPKPMRMAVPMLASECFGRFTADGESPACSWDNGFPAISNDGRQVAELVIAGPVGPTDVSVVIYDVATNKVARTIAISKEGELDFENQDEPKFRAKVIQRTATAQRVLDAGKFRALRSLGSHMASDGAGDPLATPTATGEVREIHSEWLGATMRLLDPHTNTELFRHTFSAASPRPAKLDEECSAWSLVSVAGWWDPQSRVVVGQLLHHHGGCMCGSTTVTQAFAY
jgi:hypothetical protein